MEQSSEFDLDLAIQHQLDAYNAQGMLSPIDRDELLDHLYEQTQDLMRQGLSTEEAFLISQKRLGTAEVLSSEYQKARPWTRLVQFFAFAIIFLFGLKMMLNLMQIVSLSASVLVNQFLPEQLSLFLEWGDVSLQIASIIIALVVASRLIKRISASKLKNLWPVLLTYLISEIARFTMVMIATQNLGITSYSQLSINLSYMMWGMRAIGMLFVLGMLIRHRNLSLQLA
ncbi:MAG: permease prefix domain 1-containing protein [Bacteroidota bacterium]